MLKGRWLKIRIMSLIACHKEEEEDLTTNMQVDLVLHVINFLKRKRRWRVNLSMYAWKMAHNYNKVEK